MIRPSDVVEEMRRRRTRSSEPVRFYWVAVAEGSEPRDRDAFAAELRRLASEEAVCPVVLRVPGFRDPNAVMNDLTAVLEGCRTEILDPGLTARIQSNGLLDVVLVSRRAFDLAITSSPLPLPEWFPVSPGRVVTASVTDLTLRAAVPLSASETGAGEMCRLLFELDRALLARTRETLEARRRDVNSFLDQVRDTREDSLSFHELLAGCETTLASVQNPRDFRPSTAKNPTLVGHLWRIANTKPADGLVKVAESLARATRLESLSAGDHREALLAVLARPSRTFPSPEVRWVYNVIRSIQSACQLVTAAKHADEYGRYPAWLLRSLSLHLRESLDEAVGVFGQRQRR